MLKVAMIEPLISYYGVVHLQDYIKVATYLNHGNAFNDLNNNKYL